MAYWDQPGASDEWYTPKYIFDALGCEFDTDVAGPGSATHVPCRRWFTKNALAMDWRGYPQGSECPWDGDFVWMNPPFGGRNGIKPWLDKFFAHGNGIALTPDRTSAPWWQDAAKKADAVLFIAGKVKFERPDGSIGKSPSNGTTLFAIGQRGVEALENAQRNSLGFLTRQTVRAMAQAA